MSAAGHSDAAALAEAIACIEAAAARRADGLPEEVFLLVSRLTPLVNVDLLIRNEQGETLLTWRDDAFYGPGWHVPGGIVRFKERAAERIAAVAASELRCRVDFDPQPLCSHEIIHPNRDTRGHFFSFLYACELRSPLEASMSFDAVRPLGGQWAWHSRAPSNLIEQHRIYGPYLAAPGDCHSLHDD